ncbi:MAG: BLUF domain-containing protein [Comamonadaceae bacterium]|nr:MAG: BLUF domain-containing protein [Comamonadaceae bacterium]
MLMPVKHWRRHRCDHGAMRFPFARPSPGGPDARLVCAPDPDGPCSQQAVARLVYASRARIEGSVYAGMEAIRASAVRHNPPAGVFTALLHQSGWFLQWKEGPPAAVEKIMDRVLRDPRHQDLQIVHHSNGPRLLPGMWTMAIVQCQDSPAEFARRVRALARARAAGGANQPAAVWRMLSTPQRHPRAALQDDPDAFQRVLLCSASGDGAFALVARLARIHGAEVVQRRFAGPSDLDVGTDYTDIEDGDRVLRLIAMARKGLGLGLTRAFLADYSHLVLLFGDDPARNERLFARVLQACQGLPAVPVLLGAGAGNAADARHFAMAHGRGMVYLPCSTGAENAAGTGEGIARVDPGARWLAVWPALAGMLRVARGANRLPPDHVLPD